MRVCISPLTSSIVPRWTHTQEAPGGVGAAVCTRVLIGRALVHILAPAARVCVHETAGTHTPKTAQCVVARRTATHLPALALVLICTSSQGYTTYIQYTHSVHKHIHTYNTKHGLYTHIVHTVYITDTYTYNTQSYTHSVHKNIHIQYMVCTHTLYIQCTQTNTHTAVRLKQQIHTVYTNIMYTNLYPHSIYSVHKN